MPTLTANIFAAAADKTNIHISQQGWQCAPLTVLSHYDVYVADIPTIALSQVSTESKNYRYMWQSFDICLCVNGPACFKKVLPIV